MVISKLSTPTGKGMPGNGLVTVQFVPSKVSGNGKNIGNVGRKSRNNTPITTSGEVVTVAVKESPSDTVVGFTSKSEIVGAPKAAQRRTGCHGSTAK